MKNLIVEDIVKCTDADLLIGDKKIICKTFSKDTRTIKKGDIYIGIKGESFDGNIFWEKALENGASGVIVQDIEFSKEILNKYKDKIIIKVSDTLKAIYKMASYKRDLYDIPVIAITGSVGKTSTKDIVANIVSQKYKTLKTIGNHNNNIGLPFTILNAPENIEAMVLEMGMNHFGEINLLSNIAKPTICIITNIGTSHIGNLGSRENILKAKLEILNGAKDPTIIINNDNDLLHKWAEENKENLSIITYGINTESKIKAENVILKENESEFYINYNGEKQKVNVPIGGEHFVLNSLCGIAVGNKLQMNFEEISEGIKTFELTKNRMDIINLKDEIRIINDAYNASLESIEATLKYMNNMNANKKIAVLGDVLETGNFAKELHENIGKITCENDVNILVCSGENSKYIVESAIENGFDNKCVYYCKNKDEIIELLKKIIEPKDVILFKASNGMKFFEIADKIKEIKNK